MSDENLPIQSAEDTKAALSAAPSGSGTATGMAKADLSGKQEIPTGEDRGSKLEIAGGEIQSDATQKGSAPIGLQAEPAAFTRNGSLPAGHLPSPSGLVPAAAVTASRDQAADALRTHHETSSAKGAVHEGFARVPRSVIESAPAADLRAAAVDRGWDLGERGGDRITRKRFIEKQNEKLGEEKTGDSTEEDAE